MKPYQIAIILGLGAAGLAAQASPPAPAAAALPAAAAGPNFTLAQAQAEALRARPRLLAAISTAQGAAEVPAQIRSAYFPQLTADLTGVGAEDNSRITAGALNNPAIYSRYANGIELSQLITDFGRTGSLVKSSQFQARSQQANTTTTRAQVLLQVDQAYLGALQAQAVLDVAQQAVVERQVVADQVGVLTQNQLRSQLDLSFAKVNLAQAQLLLTQAQNTVQSSNADLALAVGVDLPTPLRLEDQGLPPAVSANLTALVAEALRDRPEMASAGFSLDAARAYAQAEHDLYRPTLSAVGAAGLTPIAPTALGGDRYAAAGVNLEIPVFNGGLFGAEQREAQLDATASQHDFNELRNQIEHDVKTAWLNTNTDFQDLGLTQQLDQQATLALRLAQSRYTLGLGSIVELSQAQLNKTQADIAQAQALYQYQAAVDALNYQLGRF